MSSFDTALFDILGKLPTDATLDEINNAYRLLAQLYHPDKNPTRPEWAAENMKRLNEAKEILSDPVKRKQYEKVWKEKQAAQQREQENLRAMKTMNNYLKQRVQSTEKTNGDLKVALGLAALAFILGAIDN